MNITDQVILTVIVLIFCVAVANMITDLLFGTKEKVKYMPIPKAPITKELLILWSKYDPKRLQEYLDNLPPIWITNK